MAAAALILLIISIALAVWSAVGLIQTYVKAKEHGILRAKYPCQPWLFAICLAGAAYVAAIAAAFGVKHQDGKDYINAVRTRGITAIAEYERKTVDELFSDYELNDDIKVEIKDRTAFEDAYLKRQIALAERSAQSDLSSARLQGAVATALLSRILFMFGAFITKDGVFYFTNPKLQPTYAKLDGGKICFFNPKKPQLPYAKFPDNSENRELFERFIQQNVMEE